MRWDDEKKARRLAFKAGDKILQSGRKFAAARAGREEKTPSLSKSCRSGRGSKKPGTYRLVLAAGLPGGDGGRSTSTSKSIWPWPLAAPFRPSSSGNGFFVYDYTREDPLAVLPVTGKQYVNLALIDPTGSLCADRDPQHRQPVPLWPSRSSTCRRETFEDVKLPAVPQGMPANKEGKD